jgi:hypothetical protein
MHRVLNRRCKVTCRRTSFHREILGSLKKISKRRGGRLGSCGGDWKNPVSRWIYQRSKEVTVAFGVQAPGVVSRWIWISYPSAVGSDRSCTRVTIGIRRIGNPVVECFSTFETPKSREDRSRPTVGHVAEIEASGVQESEVPWTEGRGSS